MAAQEHEADSRERGGGFMIASAGSTVLRWHVVDTVGGCLYGEVLRAVDVVHGGYFAIKVRTVAVLIATPCLNSLTFWAGNE